MLYKVLGDVRAGIAVGDVPSVVTEADLRDRLCCEPTVRVRRCDVVSRWRDNCDLGVLIFERTDDWHRINVLGNSRPLGYSVAA